MSRILSPHKIDFFPYNKLHTFICYLSFKWFFLILSLKHSFLLFPWMQLKQLWILELSTLKIWFHNLLMCHNIRLYTPCLPVRNGSIRNVYWILGIFGNLVLQLLYFEVKGILSPHPRPVHRHGEWAPGMRLESPTIQAGSTSAWPVAQPPRRSPVHF